MEPEAPRAAGRLREAAIVAAASAAVLLCGWTDFVLASRLDLSILFVFPVAAGAWFGSRPGGAILAAVAAVTSSVVDLRSGRLPFSAAPLAWNVAADAILFALVVFAVQRLRAGLATERVYRRKIEDAYGRLDGEMLLVGEVQRSLLPRSLPGIPGHGIAVHYATSTRAGGDYYDLFALPDGRLGILLADVSGHGPASAVVMAMVRTIAHGLAAERGDGPRMLGELHRRLRPDILEGSFVTACYAVLDPSEGRVAVTLAGHPPPFLAPAAGAPSEVEAPHGLPLGIAGAGEYASAAVALRPGDALLFYTDGLTENRDAGGAFFGEEGVLRVLAGGTADAAGILSRVVAAADAHRGELPLQDDLTILVLRRAP